VCRQWARWGLGVVKDEVPEMTMVLGEEVYTGSHARSRRWGVLVAAHLVGSGGFFCLGRVGQTAEVGGLEVRGRQRHDFALNKDRFWTSILYSHSLHELYI
jgi:hypothetical protein